MLEKFLDGSVFFNDKILWGPWTMIFIAGCAVFFTVLSRGFQFRKCVFLFKNTFGRITERAKSDIKGRLSPFQAATTALAGTVGNGNIVGVATALSVGGPGAIFWMWLLALLGMMLKTAEITLAVHYRHVDEKGHLHGGPMYYMRNGLGWNFLVPLFCIGVFSNAFLGAAILQPHTVGRAFVNSGYRLIDSSNNYDPYIITALMSIITGLVVIGGISRIGRVCSKLVPFMSLVYIVGGISIVVYNFDQIPAVFAMIFKHAFAPAPAVGGFAGAAVIKAIQQGISKGMYSNEAGQGTAPMAHATADTSHPFQQGVWGAFEVFVDTILICSITAFAILSTGVLTGLEKMTDSMLVIKSFSPLFSDLFAWIIIFFCIMTFCLSTQIGFFVYYETSIINLFGAKAMKYFKWIYLIPGIIFAGVADADKLWSFATISAALCALPNLVAVLALGGVFKKLMDDYMSGAKNYATDIVDKTKQYLKMPPGKSHA
ncbi:alanine/glycine:cation symporter family protein [Planctomycetota bacterium]